MFELIGAVVRNVGELIQSKINHRNARNEEKQAFKDAYALQKQRAADDAALIKLQNAQTQRGFGAGSQPIAITPSLPISTAAPSISPVMLAVAGIGVTLLLARK